MKRTLSVILAALVVLSAVTVAIQPAAADAGSTDEIFADSVTTDRGLTGWSPSEDVVRYGAENYPGWVVKYENGHAGDLEAWANASESRTIRSRLNSSNVMVVSASPDEVGLGGWEFATTRLRDHSWVETIGVNRRASIDPITDTQLPDEDVWNKPSGAWMATYGGWAGTFNADGAAWGPEVNQTTLKNATEAVDADQVSVDGSGQRVAVLDTGLIYNESIHGDRVVGAYNALTNETVAIENSSNVTRETLEPVYDGSDSKHGSWVTTAVAGNGSTLNSSGVAPGAEIVPVKVLGDDGSGSTDAIARGLDYVCSEANADVIQMSLGSPTPSVAIESEIQQCLEEEGVSAVVVAAGNNRLTYRYVASPADAELPVITVAADDGKRANDSESAYFSAVGPDPETNENVDVSAPGMTITAAVGDQKRTLSGTSMAAPITSGVALLTLEADPSLEGEPRELRTYLGTHAEPLPEAGETEIGNGRVNAENAVTDTIPNENQTEARSADAKSRDGGNRALAGSFWREVFGE